MIANLRDKLALLSCLAVVSWASAALGLEGVLSTPAEPQQRASNAGGSYALTGDEGFLVASAEELVADDAAASEAVATDAVMSKAAAPNLSCGCNGGCDCRLRFCCSFAGALTPPAAVGSLGGRRSFCIAIDPRSAPSLLPFPERQRRSAEARILASAGMSALRSPLLAALAAGTIWKCGTLTATAARAPSLSRPATSSVLGLPARGARSSLAAT